MSWDRQIGRRLKLRDLYILMSVVDAKGMGKAADRLNMSQPAVSNAIADLEQAVGVRLVDRSRQGVEPTSYGKALIKRGVAVFDELRQGVKEIEFLADPTAGELRIGTTDPIAGVLVSRAIDRLSRRYPRVLFHVLSAETATLYHQLRERNVELIIARVQDPTAEHPVVTETLHDDTLVVVAGGNNRWIGHRKIKLADLVDEPWTLPPLDSWSGTLVAEAFRANGLEVPRATVFTFSHSLRDSLVSTGRFLTVLSDFLVSSRAKSQSLTALPVRLVATRRQVGIITLKDRTLSPVAQLFVESAREVAKQIAKSQ